MQPRSFGAQDQWIHKLAVEHDGVRNGVFLDIGCANPIDGNNTYELERVGWRGVLIDANPDVGPTIAKTRTSPFICADAAMIDWTVILKQHGLPSVLDYLSFDVDGGAVSSFMNLPLDLLQFRYITIEHDVYRFGDTPRATMRAALRERGYELLCPDVTLQGLPYEDWWVHPLHIKRSAVELFRTFGPTDCYSIVARR
jgi:hypothetical protein